jgi:hypothetical protein
MTSKQGTITADASAALGAAAASTRRPEGGARHDWIIPSPHHRSIVAFLALIAWLGMVFWADAHPEWKHAAAPGRDVIDARALRSPAEPGAPRSSELAPPLQDKQTG